jgi:Mn-dependent DtxR family transcriptional regulator
METGLVLEREQTSEETIRRAEAELRRRFASGGCMARAADFARLLTGFSAESADEALHRLWKQGFVEMECLSDGSIAYHFPRR